MSPEQVAEFKEVFMLFDKDEDGVITFPELIMVMKSLGQRPASEKFSQMPIIVESVRAEPVRIGGLILT